VCEWAANLGTGSIDADFQCVGTTDEALIVIIVNRWRMFLGYFCTSKLSSKQAGRTRVILRLLCACLPTQWRRSELSNDVNVTHIYSSVKSRDTVAVVYIPIICRPIVTQKNDNSIVS